MAAGVKVLGDAEIALERDVGVFLDAEEVNLAANLLAPLAVIVRGERKRGVRLGGLPSPLGSGSWHKHECAPYRNPGSWVRQRECNPASGCRQRFSGSAAAFQAMFISACVCVTCLSAERWLSGRKRRFANSSSHLGVSPCEHANYNSCQHLRLKFECRWNRQNRWKPPVRLSRQLLSSLVQSCRVRTSIPTSRLFARTPNETASNSRALWFAC